MAMHMRDMMRDVEITELDWGISGILKMGHYHTICGQLLSISSVTKTPDAVDCKFCMKKMKKQGIRFKADKYF